MRLISTFVNNQAQMRQLRYSPPPSVDGETAKRPISTTRKVIVMGPERVFRPWVFLSDALVMLNEALGHAGIRHQGGNNSRPQYSAKGICLLQTSGNDDNFGDRP